MGKVVCGELQFVTINIQFVRADHDSGVVDDYIDFWNICIVEDGFGGSSHTGSRAQFDRDELGDYGGVDAVD